jgi:hypothetical protein
MNGGLFMAEKISGINSKAISDVELKRLIELLNSISYGSVTLIIQEGKIVQMEKNEKLRLK